MYEWKKVRVSGIMRERETHSVWMRCVCVYVSECVSEREIERGFVRNRRQRKSSRDQLVR